jgi:tight adherence protein B
VAVFMLVRSLLIPTFGTGAKEAKRLRNRIGSVLGSLDQEATSILKDRRLASLSPWERGLESAPILEPLRRLIAQAGRQVPVYRVLGLCLAAAAVTAALVQMYYRQPLFAVLAAAAAFLAPIVKLRLERGKRLDRFEEQLPEALDVMSRGLQAGHPFTASLKLVATQMDEPISREFGQAFSDISYGVSVKGAFLRMLERMPSVSLMAVITAVLVQRESGGNLSEILQRIAAVVRARFKFQRRVKTLSAEGRASAWVLSMTPFAMAGLLTLVSPDYIPELTKDPAGRKIIGVAFVMMLLGMAWIQKIIRIKL